ncbi:DgyrCDS2355 [Dimorphilus gyrociliatus]|uniref:DgyrCDS2355 n=1 Tax=Dimorphilus gyrociliatus TaxID=2664684 RepID=A0A7I8VBC7_9ANNE|nr:DgyrCDS2355 [Dimorphilus gyrociliatus]
MNFSDLVFNDSINSSQGIADGIPFILMLQIERALTTEWRAFVASFDSTIYKIKDSDREKAAMSEHKAEGSAIREIIKRFKCRNMPVDIFAKSIFNIECNEALMVLFNPKCVTIIDDLSDEDLEILEDEVLCLKVKATGIPIPNYQWFQDEKLIEGQTCPVLHIDKLRLSDSGKYYCKFTQDSIGQKIFSKTKNLRVIALPGIRPSMRGISENNNQDCVQSQQDFNFLKNLPERISITGGGVEEFSLIVSGKENLKFMWFANNVAIDDFIFTVKDGPACSCRENHDQRCLFSNVAPVNMLKKSTISINTHNVDSYVEYKIQCLVRSTSSKMSKISNTMHFICDHRSSNFRPAQKIALLFGVSEYHFSTQLKPIEKKMQKLEQALESLEYETYSFLNINKSEMEQAIELIKKFIQPNAYFLFYYVGHGFTRESSPTTYLTDPDSDLRNENTCLTDDYIFNSLNNCQKMLNSVFVFDTCRMNSASCENGRNGEIPSVKESRTDNGYLKLYATAYGLMNYIQTDENAKSFVDYFTTIHLALLQTSNPQLSQKIHSDVTINLKRSLADKISLDPNSSVIKRKDMYIKNAVARAIPQCRSQEGRWLDSNHFGIRYKLIKEFSNVLVVHILWKEKEGYYNSNIIVNTEEDNGIECGKDENISIAHNYRNKYFIFKNLQRFESFKGWEQKFYFIGENAMGKPLGKIPFSLSFKKPLIIALKTHFTNLNNPETVRTRRAEENTDASDDSHC